MGVGRQRGDSGNPEVERRNWVTQLLAERQDETAEATVYVQANSVSKSHLAKLGDGVDGAVAVVRCRAHDGNRLIVDECFERSDIDLSRDRIDWRIANLDAQQVTRLIERRVSGFGLDEVGIGDATHGTSLIAIRKHRVQDAAATAAGDHARRLAIGTCRRSVEQVETHRDDLTFKACGAWAHIALQRVHMAVHAERLRHEGVVIGVAAVERTAGLTGVPERIFGGSHLTQFVENALAVSTLFGENTQHGIAIGIGVAAHVCEPCTSLA